MVKPMKFEAYELVVILAALNQARPTFKKMEKPAGGRVSLIAWDTVAGRLVGDIEKTLGVVPAKNEDDIVANSVAITRAAKGGAA